MGVLSVFYKHVSRSVVEFKACSRFQCICINICTDLLLLVGSMYTIARKSTCIIGKIGLVGKMPIVGRINPKSFLDTTRIVAIGLNYLKNHLLD